MRPPRTTRDRKPCRNSPANRPPPLPPASSPSTAQAIFPPHPSSLETPGAPHGRPETLKQSPAAACHSTPDAAAKSLARSPHPARIRSSLPPLSFRKLRTLPAPQSLSASAPHASPHAASSPNSVSRRPSVQSPRNSLPESSAHTLPPGSPHESGACANPQTPAKPPARPYPISPPP